MTALLRTDQRKPRWSDRLLPSLGILLVTGGLVLLAWYGWLLLTPDVAPYHYQQVSTGPAENYPDLELEAWPDLTISEYTLHVDAVDQPVAQAWFGRRGTQPQVLLDWKNQTGEPILALDKKAEELSALAIAIDKYAPKDALLLSWWDTSRQLALLTGRDVLFHSALHEPLIIPAEWSSHAQAIRAYENEQAGTQLDAQESTLFMQFARSLVASPDEGLSTLRQLAGTRDAYLVVHVTDLYKLGLLSPDTFGVAYKPYRMTGSLHGMISHVKTEMSTHNYYSYTLQSLSDELIRVFFLTDEVSYNTLLAKLLPFTSQPSPVERTNPQLIYQQGGYWVYRLTENTEDNRTDSTRQADQVQ